MTATQPTPGSVGAAPKAGLSFEQAVGNRRSIRFFKCSAGAWRTSTPF